MHVIDVLFFGKKNIAGRLMSRKKTIANAAGIQETRMTECRSSKLPGNIDAL
jgi:hypothetical protein